MVAIYGFYVWWLSVGVMCAIAMCGGCVVTMYCSYVWLLCVVVICGCYTWFLCLVAMYGCYVCGCYVCGCYAWFLCLVAMYDCSVTWLCDYCV